jgi:hypothetical protein
VITLTRERVWLLACLGTAVGLLGASQALFPASAAAIQEDGCSSGASWAVCDGSTDFGSDDYDNGDVVGDDDESGEDADQGQGNGNQDAANGPGLLGFAQVTPPPPPENGEPEPIGPVTEALMRMLHEKDETPGERDLRIRFEKLGFSPSFDGVGGISLWCAFPRRELSPEEQRKWCFPAEDPYGIGPPASLYKERHQLQHETPHHRRSARHRSGWRADAQRRAS